MRDPAPVSGDQSGSRLSRRLLTMFIDARSLPDLSRFEADVAIIGAGPAGISLARLFDDSPTRVCLIESGGVQPEAPTQALYDGESVGIAYPVIAHRLRFLGGSSNHWGGFCRPLDAIDFEQRDWVPHSGWPFGRETLLPYYERACDLVEITPPRFDDKAYWERVTGEPLPDSVTGRMQVRFVHFSPPTHFGERYGSELAASRNIDVLLNANVVNIAAVGEGRHVEHLQLQTLSGLRHRVSARVYVLATGGLENARMMLLSNDSMPAGLGNLHDLVGRFFMEHPHLSGFAELVVADILRLPGIYRTRVYADGRYATAAFNPSESFLRDRHLLNCTFMAGQAGDYHSNVAPNWERAGSHKAMLEAARHFLIDDRRAAILPSTLLGHWLGLGCACEQVPNPDSRVTLSAQRDALGLQKLRLDWRLTEQDRLSALEHMRSLVMEIGALDIGRVFNGGEYDDAWPEIVGGGSHHMGTTRMHDDPRQGVVDPNCKVHGVDNLFVAGSSVFPTGGASNPTLTLIALALRLGDHLKSLLG